VTSNLASLEGVKGMCFCGHDESFAECCQPYIQGLKNPPTAEALMRSRFSAFATHQMAYLTLTHDPQTRDQFNLDDNAKWAVSVEFIKLEIMASSEKGNLGAVEFKATYRDLASQTIKIHHEKSKFRKHKNIWYFR
jgi:SEC-C motif-containing protein